MEQEVNFKDLTVHIFDYDFEYDPNYGADADGNRGMPMWFIEGPGNFEIYNGDGVKVTEEIKKQQPNLYKEIDEVVTNSIENHLEQYKEERCV